VTPDVKELRASTGVEGLDKMLRGGLVPGRPYVLSGTAGSGRTTLGVQFLQQGVRQDERALLVAIDEPPAEIRENVRYLGWDVGKIRILDVHPTAKAYSKKVSMVEIAAQRAVGSLREARDDARTEALKQASPDLSVQSLQLMLRQEFKETRYSRVVIDSLTTLKRLSGDQDVDMGMMSLMRFLSESNLTCMLITDVPDQTSVEPEIFVSRGEIRLHRIMTGTRIERCITIEKMRGSAHDTVPRPVSITKEGIQVAPGKKVPKAALSLLQGVPGSLR
jgi:KaiC/GvpD/RAD55 family RecA-like ATPase